MRIEGQNIGSLNELQLQKAKSTAPAAATGATPTDSVEFSGDVNAISTARNVIAQTPDVRAEKVNSLRQQVQNGTYHVSALDIAKKMLAESQLTGLDRK